MATACVIPWRAHSYAFGSQRKPVYALRKGSSVKFKLGVNARVECKQATRGDRALVEECLHKLSHATGVSSSHSLVTQHQYTVSGKQSLCGMEGEWSLSWCMDGRFYEKYDGEELTFEWGFDGIHNPWYADYAGRVTALELDDLEIAQLAVFVRTGFWLTDKGQDQLDIQIKGEHSFKALKQQIGELVLTIRFKDKKVVAHITVDACQWLPLSMETNIVGQIDRWEYKDWNSGSLGFNYKFPHSCIHFPAEGGKHSYIVSYSTLTSGVCKTGEDNVDNLCAFPKTLLVPRHNKYYPRASFDISCPPCFKMVFATSGQLLVEPLIDGECIGYFVLDTGASGLSICPKQAKQLNMETFGEVFVTGFDGQVKSQFCRAKSFQLGPLTIKSPLFVEVDIENLVVGAESVVGVCGFDVFYNSIVEISCKEDQICLVSHSQYEQSCKEPPKWERIIFLQNLPNIPAKINGKDLILLFDTGAGGIDVIFHSKAEKYANLQSEGFATIKGINSTGGGGHLVQTAVIDKLEIADHCFKQVRAIYLSGTSTQMPLSEYTSGVLCMELLNSFTIVFDYRMKRVALIDKSCSYQ